MTFGATPRGPNERRFDGSRGGGVFGRLFVDSQRALDGSDSREACVRGALQSVAPAHDSRVEDTVREVAK